MLDVNSVTVILKLPPRVLSPNCMVATIGGRYAKAAAVKAYRREAKTAAEAVAVDDWPWNKVKVHATFYHKTKHKRDQHNDLCSLKAAYDGLVDAGVVGDDEYGKMEISSSPKFLVDKVCPRVELTLTKA